MDLAEVLETAGITLHAVTVEAYAGAGPYGDTYAAAVEVTSCHVEDKRRTVRAPDGTEVVSMSTVYAPLATVAPARSRVTFADGRTTLVIAALRRDGGGAPTPNHLEIVCE